MKEGIIERTDEYKYLGWWFSNAENRIRQLHEIKSKSGYMVQRNKNNGGDKIRVWFEDMMVEYRKCYDAKNTIHHGIHNKQRNGRHGNDTRQNVAENIQCTSINPILRVTD